MKQVIVFDKPHMLLRMTEALWEVSDLTGLSAGKGQGFGRGYA